MLVPQITTHNCVEFLKKKQEKTRVHVCKYFIESKCKFLLRAFESCAAAVVTECLFFIIIIIICNYINVLLIEIEKFNYRLLQ